MPDLGTRVSQFLFPGQEKKGGGWSKGRPPVLADTRVLWNLECPIQLSQREICAHFNEGNWARFGQSAEKLRIVELRSEI